MTLCAVQEQREKRVYASTAMLFCVMNRKSGYLSRENALPMMKKNYWDDETGWLNVLAIVQSASEAQKRQVFEFLSRYFDE